VIGPEAPPARIAAPRAPPRRQLGTAPCTARSAVVRERTGRKKLETLGHALFS
jgi:hypothetical protein